MGIFSKIWHALTGWLKPDVANNNGFNVEKEGTNNPIPVIYGEYKQAPCIKVLKVSSDKKGGAKNEYLHLVCVFCEGEIDSIGTLYFNGIPETQIPNERYYAERYIGTDNQGASTQLMNEVNGWKSTATLSGVAYVYVRLKIDKKSEWWQGEPEITANIKGKKVFDPRTSTTAYSNNSVLCFHDFFTNNRYGKGTVLTKIDTQWLIDGANYIETTRTYKRTIFQTEYDDAARTWIKVPVGLVNETVTENLFGCNVLLDTSKKVKDNLDELRKGMRAILPESNGKHRIVIEKEGTPVYAFTKDNLIGGIDIAGGDLNNRYNQVVVKFRNTLTGEQDEAYYPVASALKTQWLSEDNNKPLFGEFTFNTINNKAEALQMATVIALRSRQQLSVKFNGMPETFVVEVGDIVTLDSTIAGFSAKPFRVEHATLNIDTGEMVFQAIEHQNTIYPWSVTDITEEYVDTTLALPNAITPPTGLTFQNLPAGGAHQGRLAWNAINDNNVSSHVVNIYQGQPTYIWLMFANDATGTGISAVGAGKTYIGVSFNRATSTASTNPLDYTWVLADGNGILMPNSVSGENRYLWLKFSISPTTNPLVDLPNDNFMGYKTGQLTQAKSTNQSDYTWLFNVNSISQPHDGFHVFSTETQNNEIYTDNLNLGFHTIEVSAKNSLFESVPTQLITEITTDYKTLKPALVLSADNHIFFTDSAGTTTPSSIVITATHSDSNVLYNSIVWTTTPAINITDNKQTITIAASDFGANQVVKVSAVLEGLTSEFTLLSVKDGVDGNNGLSAYEIWLSQGNTGTEADFIAYLNAIDGVNGNTWHSVTTGAPANSLGVVGDFALSAGRYVYEKTAAAVWTYIKDLLGQRGSRWFYYAITTSAWTNAKADLAITSGGSTKVIRDIVTLYNNSTGFSLTKFWDGSAWLTIAQVVDGNLLVDGSIGAAKLLVDEIFAQDITATGVITGATVQTDLSGAAGLRAVMSKTGQPFQIWNGNTFLFGVDPVGNLSFSGSLGDQVINNTNMFSQNLLDLFINSGSGGAGGTGGTTSVTLVNLSGTVATNSTLQIVSPNTTPITISVTITDQASRAAPNAYTAPVWNVTVRRDSTAGAILHNVNYTGSANTEIDLNRETLFLDQSITFQDLSPTSGKYTVTVTRVSGSYNIPKLKTYSLNQAVEGGAYALPTASAAQLGGVKIGNNLTISNGVLSADTQTTYSIGNGGLTEINFTTTLVNKLNGIAASANNYVLPFTNNSTSWNTAYGWGNHANAGYKTTDTNTTYSAGTAILLSGTTFSVNLGTGSTQAAYGNHNHDATYVKYLSGTYPQLYAGSTWLRTPANGLLPAANNASYLGTNAWRFIGVYAGTGNFSGNLTCAGIVYAADEISTCDSRVKENQKVIKNASEKRQKLIGKTFNRTDLNGRLHAGIIAQDLENNFDEALHFTEDEKLGKKYNVSTPAMIGLLVEAANEDRKLIDRQQHQINELIELVGNLANGN